MKSESLSKAVTIFCGAVTGLVAAYLLGVYVNSLFVELLPLIAAGVVGAVLFLGIYKLLRMKSPLPFLPFIRSAHEPQTAWLQERR